MGGCIVMSYKDFEDDIAPSGAIVVTSVINTDHLMPAISRIIAMISVPTTFSINGHSLA